MKIVLLLHNTKFLKKCSIRILWDTSYDIRLKRVMERDKISKERFDLRDGAALAYDIQEFNFIIKNVDCKSVKEIIDYYDKSNISG